MTDLGLTELENDALAEIINIGMGRAADSLSQMVAEEVKLSVPVLKLLQGAGAADEIARMTDHDISGVTQDFNGILSGRAMLLFPEKQSMNLVRLLLKDEVPLEMMSELEKEALTEVGNIILNACFGTVANTLTFELNSTLPEFVQGKTTALLNTKEGYESILILQVDFSLPSRDIKGFVTFLMDIDSLDVLKTRIQDFVSNL